MMKYKKELILLTLVIGHLIMPCFAQSKTRGGDPARLLLSKHKGSLHKFFEGAVKQGCVAVIDKPITVHETIAIDGSIEVDGEGNTITSHAETLFKLGRGVHAFNNLNIVQRSEKGTAFFTEPESQIVWENTFSNIHIEGGMNGYYSSRGGVYDEATDSVMQWSGSTFSNCTILVNGGVAISVFSQDGPCKYLHLRNVQLSTQATHNLYIHPNVSLHFDSVVSLKAGKLAMHQFSGGHEEYYFTSRYVILNRLSAPGKASWEVVRPKKGPIVINDCDMAPYTIAGIENPFVHATNSRFYNGGNGAMLTGTLVNCSGTVWSGKPGTLRIEGGSFDELNLRAGGKVEASNARFAYVFAADRGNAFEGSFENCTLENVVDGGNGQGKLSVKGGKVINQRGRKIVEARE